MKTKLIIIIVLVSCLTPIFLSAQARPISSPTSLSQAAHVSSLNAQISSYVGRSSAIELKPLLVQRQSAMLELARTNPWAFLNSKLSFTVISKIPDELKSLIEEDVSLDGRMEAHHVDDFKNPGNSHYEYFLTVGNSRYELSLVEPLPAVSGSIVNVSGSRLGPVLVAENRNVRTITAAPPLDSVGEQKTLVLLINFLDSGPAPKTREEMRELIFDGQFQKFYREQSYGRIWFTGDVMGWYTLPRSQFLNGVSGFCDIPSPYLSNGNTEVARLIRDNNIDLSKYDHFVIVTDLSCPKGLSSVGKSTYHINDRDFFLSVALVSVSGRVELSASSQTAHPFPWTYFESVLAHEMGHSLGLRHANGWDCGESVLRGDCRQVEYGNNFDVMGQQIYATHFNSFYKELLGWIKPNETIQINNSGRYTLNPLELTNGRKKLAKIRSSLATSTVFYLEYRRGTGFDQRLNEPDLAFNQRGLFVNAILGYGTTNSPHSRMLDMQPTFLPWGEDSSITTLNSPTGKEVFTDIATGISIGPILSVDAPSVTFDVGITKPQCARSNPVVESENNPFLGYLAPGGTRSVLISYRNGDSSSCGSSNFRVETNLLTSWRPVVTTYQWQLPTQFPTVLEGDVSVSISPDDTVGISTEIRFTVPSNISPGTHSFTIDVVNLDTNYRSTRTFEVGILTPLNISGSYPLSGPIGTPVTITGAFPSSYLPEVILVDHAAGNHFSSRIPSDGNTINFTIPKSIQNIQCQCLVATPPGMYKISVVDLVSRESVDFEVTELSSGSSFIAATPPDGAIDARGVARGKNFNSVKLSFPSSPNGISASDFRVSNSSVGDNLSIRSVAIDKSDYTVFNLLFSRSLVAGEQVRITHNPSGSSVCLGFLPGDVNQDGYLNFADAGVLSELIDRLKDVTIFHLEIRGLDYKYDINHDQRINSADLTAWNEVRAQMYAQGIYRLPACPSGTIGYVPATSQVAATVASLNSLQDLLNSLRQMVGGR